MQRETPHDEHVNYSYIVELYINLFQPKKNLRQASRNAINYTTCADAMMTLCDVLYS